MSVATAKKTVTTRAATVQAKQQARAMSGFDILPWSELQSPQELLILFWSDHTELFKVVCLYHRSRVITDTLQEKPRLPNERQPPKKKSIFPGSHWNSPG